MTKISISAKNFLFLFLCFALLLPLSYTSSMQSSNYIIEKDSINFSGTDESESSSYRLSDTMGEIGSGDGASLDYGLSAGYRQVDAATAGYTISISSPADVTLSPSFGGISGGTGNGSAIWKVTTDNPSGYQLDIRAGTSPALKSGSYSFADYIPSGPDPDYDWSVASSDSEFGYSVEGAHTVGKFLDNGSACSAGSGNISDKCWLGFSTSNATIAAGASSNDPSGTETTVKFRAEAGSQRMQESGDYAAAIVVTAIQL